MEVDLLEMEFLLSALLINFILCSYDIKKKKKHTHNTGRPFVVTLEYIHSFLSKDTTQQSMACPFSFLSPDSFIPFYLMEASKHEHFIMQDMKEKNMGLNSLKWKRN